MTVDGVVIPLDPEARVAWYGARRAGEIRRRLGEIEARLDSLRQRNVELAAGGPVCCTLEHVRQAWMHREMARRWHVDAARRVPRALRNCAGAHERAAATHERLATRRAFDATTHRASALEHRAAASIDRRVAGTLTRDALHPRGADDLDSG